MSDGFHPVRHERPFAMRRFRHRETGEEAILTMQLMFAVGTVMHKVKVVRSDGGLVPGVPYAHQKRSCGLAAVLVGHGTRLLGFHIG